MYRVNQIDQDYVAQTDAFILLGDYYHVASVDSQYNFLGELIGTGRSTGVIMENISTRLVISCQKNNQT